MGRDMVKAFRFGRMARSTRASGTMIKLKVMVDSSVVTAQFMRVNGRMTRLMAKGDTLISIVLTTKETGSSINSTVEVRRSGQINQSTKASLLRVESMVRAPSHGQMGLLTKETATITTFMA